MGGVFLDVMPHYNTDDNTESGLVWVCGSSIVLCGKEREKLLQINQQEPVGGGEHFL